MNKFTIKQDPLKVWGGIEIYKNDVLITTISDFYDIDRDWITIYEVVGGQGTGYRKGNVKQKIYIGDSELITIKAI